MCAVWCGAVERVRESIKEGKKRGRRENFGQRENELTRSLVWGLKFNPPCIHQLGLASSINQPSLNSQVFIEKADNFFSFCKGTESTLAPCFLSRTYNLNLDIFITEPLLERNVGITLSNQVDKLKSNPDYSIVGEKQWRKKLMLIEY